VSERQTNHKFKKSYIMTAQRKNLFFQRFLLSLLPLVTLAWGDTLWTKTFDLNWADLAGSIKQLTDSNFILIGRAGMNSASHPNTAVFIAKLDKNGNSIWTKTYGGSDQAFQASGIDVLTLDDGGFIFLADSWSFGGGSHQVWIIRTNNNGDTLWTKTYTGYSKAICQTIDQGYIIACLKDDRSFWLFKIDSTGVLQWERSIGAYSLFSIFRIGNTNSYICSACNSISVNQTAGYLLWLDSLGNIIKSLEYDKFGYSFIACPYNNGIIAGGLLPHPSTNPDMGFLKVDSSGGIIWQQFINKAGAIREPSFAIAQDGNILLATCFVNKDLIGPEGIAVLKINNNGKILNSEIIQNHGQNISAYIQPTIDGGYILLSSKLELEQSYYNEDIFVLRASNQFRNTTLSAPILISGKIIDQSTTQLSINNFSLSELPDSISIRYSHDSISVGLSNSPNLVFSSDSLQNIFLNGLTQDTAYYFSISYKNIFGAWSEISSSNITKLVTKPDPFPSDPIQRFSFSPTITRIAPDFLRFSWSPMEFDDERIKWIGVSIDTSSYPKIDSTHPPQYVFNKDLNGFEGYFISGNIFYMTITAGIGNMDPIKWADRLETAKLIRTETNSSSFYKPSNKKRDISLKMSSKGRISYNLFNDGNVKLEIFNASGKLVSMPINSYQRRGAQQFQWSINNISSGIYYCRLSISNVSFIVNTFVHR
jgi:hypothetical protein